MDHQRTSECKPDIIRSKSKNNKSIKCECSTDGFIHPNSSESQRTPGITGGFIYPNSSESQRTPGITRYISKKCINKSCIKCCQKTNKYCVAINHNRNKEFIIGPDDKEFIIGPDDKEFIIGPNDKSMIKQKESKIKKSKIKYSSKCICNKGKVHKKCDNGVCCVCCTSNYDKCKIHISQNRCKCKKGSYNKNCINKLCKNCCDNTNCTLHYDKCSFCEKYKKRSANSCSTKACSGKCCLDRYCEYHFDVFDNITQKDINDFKKILSDAKPSLPTNIINIIIDGYVDNRHECYVCNKKLSDIENAFEEYEVDRCERCRNWCCGENYNCMIFKKNKNIGWWYSNTKICKKCYTKDDDTFDSEESDD